MKTTFKYPEKTYPYLALWAGEGQYLSEWDINKASQSDIVLISLVEKKDEDSKVYVSFVIGGKEGYFTQNEKEYFPLPKGYEINLIQS